jgi:hypothetical protein
MAKQTLPSLNDILPNQLPTPQEVETELNNLLNGQRQTYIYDNIERKKPQRQQYRTNAGRVRFSTLIHPHLKKVLNDVATAHNRTAADILETALLEYFKITLPK